MELTYSHQYNKNTSISGMIRTEHLLNTGKRPQISERARKPPHNWIGQKKKGKKIKKGTRMGTAPQGGNYKEGNFPKPRKVPSTVRRSARMEEKLQSLRECSNQSEEGKTEGDLHRWSPPPCAPQPETLAHHCGQGLGAEARASEVRSR